MIECPRTLRALGFACGAALLLGAPLRAQAADLSARGDSTAAVAAATAEVAPTVSGPTRDAASVAVRRTAASDAAAPQPATRHERGTALMIVGGAAILTGIVIANGAGYAISVAGAVIGLYGLYQYLQ